MRLRGQTSLVLAPQGGAEAVVCMYLPERRSGQLGCEQVA